MKTTRLLRLLPLPALCLLASALWPAPAARAQIDAPDGLLSSGPITSSDPTQGAGYLNQINWQLVSSTFAIAPSATLTYDGGGIDTLHRLVISSSNSLTWVLDTDSQVTFSNNNSSAGNGGAAVNIASSATVVYDGSLGAGFIFEDNVSGTHGGVFNLNGANAFLSVTNALFQTNTSAATGGVMVMNNAGTASFSDVTFANNYSTSHGSALAVSNVNAFLNVSNFLITTNTAGGGGAFFMNAGTATFTSGTFLNNVSNGANGGGAVFLGGPATGVSYTAEFNDVTFIGNKAPSAAATTRGGAISVFNGNTNIGTLTVNYNVSPGNTVFMAANTYGSGAGTPSGIAFSLNPNTANFLSKGVLNVFTDTDATFEMLDPFYVYLNNAAGGASPNTQAIAITINKDGPGTWKIAGDNIITKATSTGNATGASININKGTLYLYRAGEQVFVPGLNPTDTSPGSTVTASTANITITTPMNSFGNSFILAKDAVLFARGGNKISQSIAGSTATANPGGFVFTLAQGSILQYDLVGAKAAALGSTGSSPLLSVAWIANNANTNANSLTFWNNGKIDIARSGTFNFSINFDTWTTGSFNLFSFTRSGTDSNRTPVPFLTTGLLASGTLADTIWQPALLNAITFTDPDRAPDPYDITTGVSLDPNGNLWIAFTNIPHPNNVVNWTGAYTTVWSSSNWTDPLGAPIRPTTGDIANLAGTPVSGTLDVAFAGGAVVGGLYISGPADYTIIGNSIETTTATVGLTIDPATDLAASGKLVLGGSARADASNYDTAPYDGTLTLANTYNNFQQGIDLLTGHLVGNAKTLATGTPGITNSSTLTFNQLTSGTFASSITGTGIINKIGPAALTLTGTYSAFTGDTFVNEGLLTLDHTSLGGNVTISSTLLLNQSTIFGVVSVPSTNTGLPALLGGAGSVLGTVTIDDNNILQVGLNTNAGQSFDIAGNLVLGDLAPTTLNFTNIKNQITIAGDFVQVNAININITSTNPGLSTLISVTGPGGLDGSPGGNIDLNQVSIYYSGTLLGSGPIGPGYTLYTANDSLNILFTPPASNKIISWSYPPVNNQWNTTVANWTDATSATTTFSHGDIVNLDTLLNTDGEIQAGTLNLNNGDVTLAALYVAGDSKYTINTANILIQADSSVLAPTMANGGKLVLGMRVLDDESAPVLAPFGSTLDLSNQPGVNLFTGGIDFYSGALRISTLGQLGTTLSQVAFLSSATDTPSTISITPGSSILLDSSGSATNRLTLLPAKSAAFTLGDGATLTLTNNNTPDPGAAITVAEGARLSLAATGSASYILSDNLTLADGAALNATGSDTRVEITNASFTFNTATANAGAINVSDGASVTINNATFRGNRADANGGVLAITSAAGDPATSLSITNLLIDSNTAAGLGAVAYIDAGSLSLTSGTIINNLSTSSNPDINASVLWINNAANVSLTDISMLENKTPNGPSAAIAIASANGPVNLALDVTKGISNIAGNGYSIYDHYDNPAATGPHTINLDIAAGTTLDMLDPFLLWKNNAADISIAMTGGGYWNLSGDNILENTAPSGAMSIAINQGALYLYRAGEKVTIATASSTTTYTAAAGNLQFKAASLSSPASFTLATKANLAIGGGNSITFTGMDSGASLTLESASVLTYSLAALPAGLGASPASPLLKISMPGGASTLTLASSGTFNFDLNFANWSPNTSSNLLYADKNGANFISTLGFAPGGPWQQALLDNLTYTGRLPSIEPTFSIDSTGNLWVTFPAGATELPNVVNNWTGRKDTRLFYTNWTQSGSRFSQGDIVNFADATTVEPDADLLVTATVAALYFSGTTSYNISGAGITAARSSGDWDADIAEQLDPVTSATLVDAHTGVHKAAIGKLIIGGSASPDGTSYVTGTTLFTGTIDFTGQTGANNFTEGVDIYGGALRLSKGDQLGAPLAEVNVLGNFSIIAASNESAQAAPLALAAASAPGNFSIVAAAAPTTANNNVIFDGKNTDTHLTIGTVTTTTNSYTVNLIAQPGSNLTFANYASGSGGAILVDKGSTLNILGSPNSRVVFSGNDATGAGDNSKGGAIYVNNANLNISYATFTDNVAAGTQGGAIYTLGSSTLTIKNTLFTSNTTLTGGNNNGGGAIFMANGGYLFIDSSTFLRNYATSHGCAIYANSNFLIQNSDFEYNRSGYQGTIHIQSGNVTGTLNSVVFRGNFTNRGGVMNMSSNGINITANDSFFISNTSNDGGAFRMKNTSTLTLSNCDLLDNLCTATKGGAIYVLNAGVTLININVPDNLTNRIAGNTEKGGVSNFLRVDDSGANLGKMILTTGTDATLDMLDPFAVGLTANGGYDIIKNGPGTWNLAGSSTMIKTNDSVNKLSITVNEGTLNLYGPGIPVYEPLTNRTYTTAAATIFMSSTNAAIDSSAFKLLGASTLSAGGANSITASQVVLSAAATLTLDLTSAVPSLTGETPVLTITTNTKSVLGLTANGWTQNLNLQNLAAIGIPEDGDYINLIALTSVNPNDGQGFLTNASGAIVSFSSTTGYDAVPGFQLETTTNSGTLRLFYNPQYGDNLVTNWRGDTISSTGNQWAATPNWLDAAGTPVDFNKGNIINLVPGSPVTTIDVNTRAATTVSAMFVSGDQDFTITGRAIIGNAAYGTLASATAAVGKLVIGGSAAMDADSYATVPYTGKITFANGSAAAPSDFRSGVDINSGTLALTDAATFFARGNGIHINPAGTLEFAQTASTASTYFGFIYGDGEIIKTNSGTVTLTGYNLFLTGTVRVLEGSLLLAGDRAILGGDVLTLAGATFGGVGTIGNPVNVANGFSGNVTITPGAFLAPQAGLNILGALNLLDASTIIYAVDIGTDPAGRPLFTGNPFNIGSLNIATTATTTINLTNLATGTYTILTSAAPLLPASTANFQTLVNGVAPTSRYNTAYSLANSASTLILSISAYNINVTWNRAFTSGTWNIFDDTWTSSLDTKFITGDRVSFATSSGTNYTVTVTDNVNAADMFVTTAASANLTFNGPGIINTNANNAGALHPTDFATNGTPDAPTGKLVKSGPASLNFSTADGAPSYNFAGGIDILAGNITGHPNTLITSTLTIFPGASVTFSDGNNVTYTAPITGGGDLIKQGGGRLQLNGILTYTGNTKINGGGLRLNRANQLQNTLSVTIAASSTLDTAANAQILPNFSGANTSKVIGTGAVNIVNSPTFNSTWAGVIEGNRDVTFDGPLITFTANNTFIGTFTILSGTVQFGAGAIGGNVSGTGAAGTGQGVIAPVLNVNGNNVLINHGPNNITMATKFAGTGVITKLAADTGVLTLTGSSLAFTGTTFIQAGSLNLNNTSLGGLIVLSDSTSLSGYNRIGSLTTLGSSTITLGTQHGNVTAARTLNATDISLSSGTTTFQIDLFDPGTNDRLIANSLTTSGDYIMDLFMNTTMTGTYTLMRVAGGYDTFDLNTLHDNTRNQGQELTLRAHWAYSIVSGSNLVLDLYTSNTTRIWSGLGGNVWQNNVKGWLKEDAPDDKFANGDSVLFRDFPAGVTGVRSIGIVSTGVIVADMTVTGTGNYTFTGGPILATPVGSTLPGNITGKLTLDSAFKGITTLQSATGIVNNFTGGIDILSGTLQGSADTLRVGPGSVILNNSALVFNQNRGDTYPFPIIGTGAIVKTGAYSLVLSNTVNYYGGLTVNANALTINNTTNTTQGPIKIAAAAALTLSTLGDFTFLHPLTGTGILNLEAPGGSINFDPSISGTVASAFLGTLYLGAGTFNLAGPNTAALAKTSFQSGTGNATIVGSGTQTIGNLAIQGGKLDFTSGIIATNTFTIYTTGTVKVNVPLPDSQLPPNSDSLFIQASGTTLAQLITSSSVINPANVVNLVLVNQNDVRVTSTSLIPIAQAGQTVATGIYDYKLDATGGLNVKYHLTAVDILPGKNLLLAPSIPEDTYGTFDATFLGTGSVTIDGSILPVTLARPGNAFAGTITLAAGLLNVSNTNVLGGPNSTLVQLPNTTLNTGTFSQTLGTLVTQPTALTNIYSGTLTIANGGTLDGTLAGFGALRVTGGNLDINAPAGPWTNYYGAVTTAATGTVTLNTLNTLTGHYETPGLDADGNPILLTWDASIYNTGVLNINNPLPGKLPTTISGNGTVNFNGPATVTIARTNYMSGQVTIAPNVEVVATTPYALGNAAVTIFPDATLSYTYSGTGVGGISNSFYGAGTLNLATSLDSTLALLGDSNFEGNINVAPNSTINAGYVLSVDNPNGYAPYSLRATNLNIGSGATVNLVANYAQLVNVNMADASTLAFATNTGRLPGSSATIHGNLTSSGTANLFFNANVTGVNPKTDHLIVEGEINGHFNILVNNTVFAPPNLDGPTLTLITYSGGDATFAGAGSLDNLGPTLWDWNIVTANGLVSVSLNRAEALAPLGSSIVANANGVLPLTWFAELDTLSRRLGDLHNMLREKPGLDLWLRSYTHRLNVNNNDTIVPFTETQFCTEVGLDYGGFRTENKMTGYLGAFIGYGNSTRDIDNFISDTHGAITNKKASGDTTSYHLGAYASLCAANGAYIDLVLKYNHFKNHFTALYGDNEHITGDGTVQSLGGSLEVGKRQDLGRNFFLTPAVQMALVHVQASRANTDAPTAALCNTVSQEAVNSLLLRAGFLLGKKFTTATAQSIQPYAKFYLARQWSNGGAITITGRDSGLPDPNTYNPTIQGTRVEAGLGINWQLLRNLQLYLDYDCAWAHDYKKPLGLTLGANYSW